MKSFVVIMLMGVVAAVAATEVSSDVVEVPAMVVTYEDVDVADVAEAPELALLTALGARNNLSVGTIGNSRLLVRTTHVRGAAANVIHVQDITYRSSTFRIAAIRVRHVGTIQGSSSSIRSGGVGSNFVTVRLQSARGRGYHYTIEIYGR